MHAINDFHNKPARRFKTRSALLANRRNNRSVAVGLQPDEVNRPAVQVSAIQLNLAGARLLGWLHPLKPCAAGFVSILDKQGN
jgi:hypothetical protein